MTFRIFAALGAACTVISLTACGGGGGGEGGVAGFPVVPQQVAASPSDPASTLPPLHASPLAGGPVVSTVTLTGKVTYDVVPNQSGPLVYADTIARPVRAASVEVVNAKGGSLGVATTDDNGAYAVTVPARTTVVVRVYAHLLRSGAGPNWDVSVRDNTKEDALYAMESNAFSTGTAALTRDLRAASAGAARLTRSRVWLRPLP